MIKSYKRRTIRLSEPVEVYRNLHRSHRVEGLIDGRAVVPVYSIRQRGRVVGHARELHLFGVTFHVSEAGRQRVLATGRKNVHAFMRGFVTSGTHDWTPVVYNPRVYRTFVRGDMTDVEVVTAFSATLGPFGIKATL